MRRRTLVVGAIVAALAAGTVALTLPSTRWRLQLIFLKVTGDLPTLGWKQVVDLVAPGSGIWPQRLWETRNPYVAVASLEPTPEVLAAGRKAFETHCSGCHGPDGRGGSAPSFVTGEFRRGASDLALFLTVRYGVPGTAMGRTSLQPMQAWSVVEFIKSLVRAESRRLQSATPVADAEAESFAAKFTPQEAMEDWPTWHGIPDGRRHSGLTDIDRATVGSLKLDWRLDLPDGDEPLQVSPLVRDATLFVNLPTGEVWALNASTGEIRWHHAGDELPRGVKRSDEGPGGRGIATWGNLLFVPTFDGQMVALDAGSGDEVWRVRVADYRDGYTIVGAPLVADDRVVIGVAGSERGIRGFLAAYSVRDGRPLWRFDTVSRPRGGGLTSVTGTFDAQSGLIYWGAGNPSPAFAGHVRPGDNLYTSSVLALEAGTGRLRWHYQLVPHDEWDWGVTHVPVLADDIDGRNALLVASRNGFLYALDRGDGSFLRAGAFARQTWNAGFDRAGRPLERPHARPSLQGTLTWPGHAGATGWQPPSYDPERRLFFVATRDGYGSLYFSNPRLTWPDGSYWGGQAATIVDKFAPVAESEVRALSVDSGELRWTYRFSGAAGRFGGILSTATGLVFAGAGHDFVALDAASGRELWHFRTEGRIEAAPITYRSGGRQRIALAAGRSLLVFARGQS